MSTTNANKERSFSTIKWIMSYLRLTIGGVRLSHLILLHVHKDLIDGIDIVEIANLFVGDNQSRNYLFGKFS